MGLPIHPEVLWTDTLAHMSLNNNNNSSSSNNNNNRVVVEWLSSQSVRPLRVLTGEARSRPGVTVAGGLPVQSDTVQNYYIV